VAYLFNVRIPTAASVSKPTGLLALMTWVALATGVLLFPPDCFGAQPLGAGWSDQSSADTTPITFSIDEVQYTVPRNYITWMDHWNGGPQTLVSFAVTFPGLQPFTEKTRICFRAAPANRPADCVPVTFFVRRGHGDPTDDQAFDNARKLFHSESPLPGPYGFELYETGPAEARIDTYRKNTIEHTLLVSCFRHGERTLSCDNHSRLPNGNVLEYHLTGAQLEIATSFDAGIRTLIASFTIPGRRRP
jgi:hypothetical protein